MQLLVYQLALPFIESEHNNSISFRIAWSALVPVRKMRPSIASDACMRVRVACAQTHDGHDGMNSIAMPMIRVCIENNAAYNNFM